MAEMFINSQTIKSQAEQLSNLNVQFKSNVQTLSDQEQALNSSWEGEARQRFHDAFVSDYEQMNRFYDEIQRYVSVLMSIAARYEQAESANAEAAATRTYH